MGAALEPSNRLGEQARTHARTVKTPTDSNSHRTLRWVLLAKAGAGVALTLVFVGGWWLRSHGMSGLEYANEMKRNAEPRFNWRSVDRRHWQALGRAGVTSGTPGAPGSQPSEELTEVTDAREANGAGCAAGMVRVKGNFRHDRNGEATGEIERIQDGACTDWISKEFPARCRTFDREKIAEDVSKLPTRPRDFCMDRFEYPNVLGQNPVIVVTFHEAEALCKKSSKRLCNENEWTFACEGEEVRPYPYGWTRDASSCVVDRTWRPFAEGALQPRDGAGARAELDRLWQAEPSYDLRGALVAASLRTDAPAKVMHRAQFDVLAAKDAQGQYLFNLHDESHKTAARADWLGVSDTERAPAPPPARDTVECPPLFAEMAVTCGDEVAA